MRAYKHYKVSCLYHCYDFKNSCLQIQKGIWMFKLPDD